MTNQEMKQEFLILYDKITNFDAPGYSDLEISIFLTKGQERVFFSFYNPLGNLFREGFEETEARRKDLQELVAGATISAPSAVQTGTLPNGVFYDLPSDCLYVISETVTTSSDLACSNNKKIRVKPITHDEYAINLNNPFKNPNINSYIWRLDYNTRRHELITDGTFTIANYHIRYIKTLTPIVIGSNTVDGISGPQNCLLNAITHKRIIEEAVKIATGITDPEFYQIKTIEQKENES